MHESVAIFFKTSSAYLSTFVPAVRSNSTGERWSRGRVLLLLTTRVYGREGGLWTYLVETSRNLVSAGWQVFVSASDLEILVKKQGAVYTHCCCHMSELHHKVRQMPCMFCMEV